MQIILYEKCKIKRYTHLDIQYIIYIYIYINSYLSSELYLLENLIHFKKLLN